MTKEKVATKGFKAFDADMKCRGFQYKAGKTYEEKGPVSLCNKGFHFCKYPLDVLDYYDLIPDSMKLTRFAEVEAQGEIQEDKAKSVTAKIHISKELSVADLVKAHVGLVFEFCFKKSETKKSTASKVTDLTKRFLKLAASGYGSKLAASGDGSKLAASGYGSQLAASGDGSKLAASGDGSKLAASGYGSQLAASGDGSKLAASGYGSKLAASGDGSKLAASGDGSKLAASGYGSQLAASGYGSQLAASGYGSQLAASGYGSKLAASGYGSQLAASGPNSVVAGVGINNTAKAKDGCWIVLAEWVYEKDRYIPRCVKVGRIGEGGLKADVAYQLKNGEFVAVL